MNKRTLVAVAIPLLVLLAFGASATANGGSFAFGARLSGYEETPAINSNATGFLKATVNSTGTSISYTLSYSGFTSTVLFSHIHFGQRSVAGGVAVFLCGGGNKPACPQGSGTVTGTIVASDVVGPTAQGIALGDLASVLRAIRAGVAYANVHTSTFPNGEIRGQIRAVFGDDNQQ